MNRQSKLDQLRSILRRMEASIDEARDKRTNGSHEGSNGAAIRENTLGHPKTATSMFDFDGPRLKAKPKCSENPMPQNNADQNDQYPGYGYQRRVS